MTAVAVELIPAVACVRDEDWGLRPLPEGYSLDRLTVVRADQVQPGDLVVGDADQPLRRGSRMRWVNYLNAPYVARPAAFDADCPSCEIDTRGNEGPWITLYPHLPAHPDEMIAVIPAAGPVEAAPAPCVHACTCENGFLRQTTRSFYPPAVCNDCHRRPCGACAEVGRSTH
jgi:hypothetical protein